MDYRTKSNSKLKEQVEELEEAERGMGRGIGKGKREGVGKGREEGRTEAEKQVKNLCDHRIGKYVLDMTPNAYTLLLFSC